MKLMHNSKVFITGINGFVGQNLRPYLAKDFNIKAYPERKKFK